MQIRFGSVKKISYSSWKYVWLHIAQEALKRSDVALELSKWSPECLVNGWEHQHISGLLGLH